MKSVAIMKSGTNWLRNTYLRTIVNMCKLYLHNTNLRNYIVNYYEHV